MYFFFTSFKLNLAKFKKSFLIKLCIAELGIALKSPQNKIIN